MSAVQIPPNLKLILYFSTRSKEGSSTQGRQEGHQEGRQEGRKEGRQEGRKEGQEGLRQEDRMSAFLNSLLDL